MIAPSIEAQSLCKTHMGTECVRAVDEVNVRVSAGERVAVVGRSGSGKSTFLNLLAGLDHPTSGELTVGGQKLHELSTNGMAQYRQTTIGVIFQAFQLIPQRTAMQNVVLPLILAGQPKRQREELAEHWLDKVGLSHRARHHPYQMSGGEQQRVAIARALIHQPSVVLADEPTGNLDSSTADDIVRLMIQLCDDTGATFLLVTHDMGVANRICNRQLLMQDGQLTEAACDA